MSEKKDIEGYQSEEPSSQAESVDASKSGTSETYDMKDFCPGIRIEAKDFDGKWYPAKVSDVDWTENEILVHFENWNTKFDEWIPMDSSRLRPIQKPIPQQKDLIKFTKGEEVMAVWSANQKYPGIIQAVLANDRYDVLFSDGFLKRLKGHKISKLPGGTLKPEVKSFVDIGTKEERRERKRKINVAELFHINKRSKKKGLLSSKSQDIKTYPVCKSRAKSSVIKTVEDSHSGTAVNETKEVKQSEEKLGVPGTSIINKAPSENIPAAFKVKYLNGQTETWSKQLYQRSEGRTAGKLDIIILNPQGRKFRSRNEIMKYCEENGIVYSHEAFDFSAKGRPKSKSVVQTPIVKHESNAEDKEKLSLKKVAKKAQNEVVESADLIPALPLSEVLPQETTTPNKVFIGDYEVVIENGKFICPVKACAKHFRRENLLHMHMKHYHPEFSKYLDSTPSVTDLAYARTVGNLDAVETPPPAPRKIPCSDKLDKSVTKVETFRKASDVSSESAKDPKKLKISDYKMESRTHTSKPSSDAFSISLPSSEEAVEESSKSNIPSASLSLGSDFNNSKETETDVPGNPAPVVTGNYADRVPKDSNGLSSVSSVIKPSRHPRLHNRKKSSRYQGTFSEHIRKRRFLSQDRSRSHNRLGRHQHSQLPGKHSSLTQPLKTSVSPQSCVEDTNANTPNQGPVVARYTKPHLNLSNEIAGKNNLLTNYKALGPASEKNEKNAGAAESSQVHTDTNSLDELIKRSKAYFSSRRRFLTGLINARKRKGKTKRKCRIKRNRNSLKNAVEPSDLDQRVKENESEDIENFRKMGAAEDDRHNYNYDCNIVKVNTQETGEKTQTLQSDESLKPNVKHLTLEKSETCEENLESKFTNSSQESTKSPIKADEASKNVIDENESKISLSDKPREEALGSTENIENSPSEVRYKSGIYPKDLTKSYVLLERVSWKENVLEYKNITQKGSESYQNFKSCLNKDIAPNSPKGKKRKRERKAESGKKRRKPAKRVRFEKSVLEKWVNQGEAFNWTEHNPKKEETVRREDHKNKQRKSQLSEYFNEHVMNQQDDSSRDEKYIPNNKACGLEQAEGTEDSKSPIAVENDKVEKLRRNEIINCLCGIVEEDGLMIQCDICLCWQHGHCAGILREVDVPDKYTCAICKNPYRGRSSMKYLHDQEWLKEGTLPSLTFRSKRKDVIEQRKAILKRSHDLSGSITLLAQVIRSLRIKVNIAEKKDHPKLWLWAKKWTEKKPSRLKEESDIKEEKLEEKNLDLNNEVKEGASPDAKHLPKVPEPEAPIDSAECRLNLLDHLIHYQSLIDARLSCIESLVAELESMQDDAVNDETPDRYPRTKATVQMILRDLNTMKKIATI